MLPLFSSLNYYKDLTLYSALGIKNVLLNLYIYKYNMCNNRIKRD